jgi:hypothetical protein
LIGRPEHLPLLLDRLVDVIIAGSSSLQISVLIVSKDRRKFT